MTLDDLLELLARAALEARPTDEDALALMILLHTHHAWLGDTALSDRPGVRDVAALSQRHAAELVAVAWPDRHDATRTSPNHWLVRFITETPVEVLEDVLPPWDERLARAKQRVLSSGLVQAMTPED